MVWIAGGKRERVADLRCSSAVDPGGRIGDGVGIHQINENQLPNSSFCYCYGYNVLKMKLEILSFQGICGILLEKRLPIYRSLYDKHSR